MKKCTNNEQETCNVEKMGCEGCAYYKDEKPSSTASLSPEK